MMTSKLIIGIKTHGWQWGVQVLNLDVFLIQVNPDLKSHFEEKGFRFVGQDVEGERMEVIELDGKDSKSLCLADNI